MPPSGMQTVVQNAEAMAIPQIAIMAPPTSPPMSPTKERRQSRDTGFPEPFNGSRNTTLPHPSADLSPNACISQDDLHATHALKRRRLSFLHKHRRTVSHGYISSAQEAGYQPSQLSLLELDTNVNGAAKFDTAVVLSPRLSKEDSVSSQSRNGNDTPPASPEVTQAPRKRGLRHKWRLST